MAELKEAKTEHKRENKAKEKYMEFQILQQQLEQMQKYLEELNEKLAEFHQTKEALRDLEKVKQNSEVFVSVAQGIFAKAKLQNPNELLINVGANSAVAKTIPQVIEMIDTQMSEIEKIQVQIDGNVARITQRINKIFGELQALES